MLVVVQCAGLLASMSRCWCLLLVQAVHSITQQVQLWHGLLGIDVGVD